MVGISLASSYPSVSSLNSLNFSLMISSYFFNFCLLPTLLRIFSRLFITDKNSLSMFSSEPLSLLLLSCPYRMVWFSYFSLSSSINLFFFIFFYRADTGFDVFVWFMMIFLLFLADFFYVRSCFMFLSSFRVSFSFLKTSLLAVWGSSFLAVNTLDVVACLFYLTISEILLDFFLFDLRGFADSLVWLLLSFFCSFFMVSLCA